MSTASCGCVRTACVFQQRLTTGGWDRYPLPSGSGCVALLNQSFSQPFTSELPESLLRCLARIFVVTPAQSPSNLTRALDGMMAGHRAASENIRGRFPSAPVGCVTRCHPPLSSSSGGRDARPDSALCPPSLVVAAAVLSPLQDHPGPEHYLPSLPPRCRVRIPRQLSVGRLHAHPPQREGHHRLRRRELLRQRPPLLVVLGATSLFASRLSFVTPSRESLALTIAPLKFSPALCRR